MHSLTNPLEDTTDRKFDNGSPAAEWKIVLANISEDFYVERKEFCASVYNYEEYSNVYFR